jgi:DNA invertase Pin-like site-specific DNA recombinase
MKRAVLYLCVSTIDQTTANQERELRDVASRMGCEIVQVYISHSRQGRLASRLRDRLSRFGCEYWPYFFAWCSLERSSL